MIADILFIIAVIGLNSFMACLISITIFEVGQLYFTSKTRGLWFAIISGIIWPITLLYLFSYKLNKGKKRGSK